MAAPVLSRDPFCSGYVDSFGKWSNGFACPQLEDEPVFCCGTSTYRYCCTTTPVTDPSQNDFLSENLPLILGVAAGTLVTIVVILVVACCFCKSCACFKKRCESKRDRMHSSSTVSGVANMYSYSPGSLGGDVRRHELEDVLQDVDEVAVTRPARINNISGIGSLPRTFTSHRGNRVSFADSVGNSSVSTTTDNERQLFIEQPLPPPYNFNKLSLEEQLPYPHSFCSGDLGSGHYIAAMSPSDDSFYRATKM